MRFGLVLTSVIILATMVTAPLSLADGGEKRGVRQKKSFTTKECRLADAMERKRGRKAKWTLMVYMAGDNDLEEYVVKDIQEELAVLGSNKNVQVVVIGDRIAGYSEDTDWTGTLLFHVTEGMMAVPGNAVADWGEVNMADPQTLTRFVKWAKHRYPADHYALVFWGHAAGWRPGWNMYDETSDYDTMDLHEMTAAFEAFKKVDVVAFDGCESQWIEMAAALKNYAKVFVASQEWVDWDGIDYAQIISMLRENPFMSAEQLGIEIADSFALYDSELTASAVSLGPGLDRLIRAVDEWAIALLEGMDVYHADYVSAREATQHFSYGYGELWDTNIDLYDAAQKIKQSVADAGIQEKCQAVMDAVEAIVLYEWHNPEYSEYEDAHGLSIYWPESQDELDIDFDYYREEVEFSWITNWDEFCSEFAQLN